VGHERGLAFSEAGSEPLQEFHIIGTTMVGCNEEDIEASGRSAFVDLTLKPHPYPSLLLIKKKLVVARFDNMEAVGARVVGGYRGRVLPDSV